MDPEPARTAAAPARRAASASSLVAARAAASQRITRRRREGLQRSQQQSQRNLTVAAVAAKLNSRSLTATIAANHSSFKTNQSISHLELVSLTILLCVLRLRVSDKVPGRLIQGALVIPGPAVQVQVVTTRVDLFVSGRAYLTSWPPGSLGQWSVRVCAPESASWKLLPLRRWY